MLIDLRYRLEYALVLSLVGLVRLMPLPVATAFGAFLVKHVIPNKRRHRRALANLAFAYPDKTPEEREAIAMAMWDNVGRTFAEMFLLDRILKDRSRLIIEDDSVSIIKRYAGKMGGSIYLHAHGQLGSHRLAADHL
jgi:Kdo2-lipid IVA lauroyltransferase/acyltransferase